MEVCDVKTCPYQANIKEGEEETEEEEEIAGELE